MMAITFFVREFSYSRGVLILSVLLQFITIAVWKYLYWKMELRLNNTILDTLIIGNLKESTKVYNRLKIRPELNLKVKYIDNNNGAKDWAKVIDEIQAVIVCADLDLKEKSEIVHTCNIKNKKVILIPDIYEVFCSNAVLDKIDDRFSMLSHYTSFYQVFQKGFSTIFHHT